MIQFLYENDQFLDYQGYAIYGIEGCSRKVPIRGRNKNRADFPNILEVREFSEMLFRKATDLYYY